MKHNRLFGCLLAIAMLMVASVSAMAQEYVLKTVSFLKPGEKGVLAVSMKNPNPVEFFQGLSSRGSYLCRKWNSR